MQNTDEKETLKQKLKDINHSFTHDELVKIIEREFFGDHPELDHELVDIAMRRLAALNGTDPDDQSAQMAIEMLKTLLLSDK